MLNGIVIWAEKRPAHGVDVVAQDDVIHVNGSMWAGIILLQNCVSLAIIFFDDLGV